MAHDHTAHDHKADARAAYMGLIFSAIFLFLLAFTITRLTSRTFEGHAPADAAAPAATH